MNTLNKKLYTTLLSLMFIVPNAFGFELSGSVSVNQVSDTAAKAKTNAINLARRQILSNVLSQYTAQDYLNDAMEKSTDDDLTNLISSTSVSNEQISSDTYSANVTMNIDNDAVKKWLTAQGIQNWIPEARSDEKFTAFIVVQNGIFDWAELKRIAREDNIDLEMQSMTGNQVFATMPLNYRSKFTANIRNIGWKYTDNGGILQIWK